VNDALRKVGFGAGLLAFGSTLAFIVVQLLQIAHALRYPWDEILIYGCSLCIVLPFVVEILALHHRTAPERQFWSHAALICSILYAVFVTANYVVQLATVLPMSLKGASEEVRLLRQTPHSLFWDFDGLGYVFMGLALLAAVPVFERRGFEGWVRGFFLAHGLTTPLIGVVYFYPHYSERLLLLFGLPWCVTAPGSMLLLALHLRKAPARVL